MPGNHPDIAGVLFSFFMSQLYGKAELRGRIRAVYACLFHRSRCALRRYNFFNRILNI